LSPMSRAKKRLSSREVAKPPSKSDMRRFINRFVNKSPRKSLLKQKPKSSTPRRESRNSNSGDDDDDVEEVPAAPVEVRSRFFLPGKRLLLPTEALSASARDRPLVKEVARSAPPSGHGSSNRGVTESGRRVRGKTVVNKTVERRRHTAEK